VTFDDDRGSAPDVEVADGRVDDERIALWLLISVAVLGVARLTRKRCPEHRRLAATVASA